MFTYVIFTYILCYYPVLYYIMIYYITNLPCITSSYLTFSLQDRVMTGGGRQTVGETRVELRCLQAAQRVLADLLCRTRVSEGGKM